MTADRTVHAAVRLIRIAIPNRRLAPRDALLLPVRSRTVPRAHCAEQQASSMKGSGHIAGPSMYTIQRTKRGTATRSPAMGPAGPFRAGRVPRTSRAPQVAIETAETERKSRAEKPRIFPAKPRRRISSGVCGKWMFSCVALPGSRSTRGRRPRAIPRKRGKRPGDRRRRRRRRREGRVPQSGLSLHDPPREPGLDLFYYLSRSRSSGNGRETFPGAASPGGPGSRSRTLASRAGARAPRPVGRRLRPG